MEVSIKIVEDKKKGTGFSVDKRQLQKLTLSQRMKLSYFLGDLRHKIRTEIFK